MRHARKSNLRTAPSFLIKWRDIPEDQVGFKADGYCEPGDANGCSQRLSSSASGRPQGRNIFTRFLPDCFASYKAWSERLVMSSGLLSAPYCPTPALMEREIRSWCQVSGA